jgi:LmbE family N-acetylglucosaminyl deacetylase
MVGLTILAIFAHPDDEVLACGGTLARAVDGGARVVLVCASRGELGPVSDTALVADGDLGRVRAVELKASAEVLGIDEVVLLDHPDGTLRWATPMAQEIAGAFERIRPAAVITFDTDGLYWHGDHIGVHEWTTRAVRSLGRDAPPLYYATMPEGAMRAAAQAAHDRGGVAPEASLWGISPDAFGVASLPPSFRVDVRPWAARKLAALRCHRTQTGPRSLFHWMEEEDVRSCLGVELFRRAPTHASGAGVLETLAEKGERV